MRYKVRIQRTETYNLDVEVEAFDARNAIATVQSEYDSGQYDTEFDCPDDVEQHIYCPEEESEVAE